MGQTSILNSHQQNLKFPCPSKCLKAVYNLSFPSQYCKYVILGTFPLTGSMFIIRTTNNYEIP